VGPRHVVFQRPQGEPRMILRRVIQRMRVAATTGLAARYLARSMRATSRCLVRLAGRDRCRPYWMCEKSARIAAISQRAKRLAFAQLMHERPGVRCGGMPSTPQSGCAVALHVGGCAHHQPAGARSIPRTGADTPASHLSVPLQPILPVRMIRLSIRQRIPVRSPTSTRSRPAVIDAKAAASRCRKDEGSSSACARPFGKLSCALPPA